MASRPFLPDGSFYVGIHKPAYKVKNLRKNNYLYSLGVLPDGNTLDNHDNFPQEDVEENNGKWIYEIPNVFPFRGTTYIDSNWAKERFNDPDSICLPDPPDCSLVRQLLEHIDKEKIDQVVKDLPKPVLYALAANSTDPHELLMLVRSCCRIKLDESNQPIALQYIQNKDGLVYPDIDDFELFETIANNPNLPDEFKDVMVLRPGVQGKSEIVGEYQSDSCHVFEYLRRNSYIPWGHYAANMANDAVRYKTSDLSLQDIKGLRHLYYQRVFIILAEKVGLKIEFQRQTMTSEMLDKLRLQILASVDKIPEKLASLWGWNFGYDFSASGYRLHASHQMIHQQYAMVPEKVSISGADGSVSSDMDAFCCGDLIADVVQHYKKEYKQDFFSDYLTAIRSNKRTDQSEGENSLIVWEDENVMLFVPKAQVSQWEMQLLVVARYESQPIGNVLEANTAVRDSLDKGILTAQLIYAGLGAKMVTSIEFSKRFGVKNSQSLLYSFLPKLPWAMGSFSEAQLRFISGHFPEDFAIACRHQLQTIDIDM